MTFSHSFCHVYIAISTWNANGVRKEDGGGWSTVMMVLIMAMAESGGGNVTFANNSQIEHFFRIQHTVMLLVCLFNLVCMHICICIIRLFRSIESFFLFAIDSRQTYTFHFLTYIFIYVCFFSFCSSFNLNLSCVTSDGKCIFELCLLPPKRCFRHNEGKINYNNNSVKDEVSEKSKHTHTT